MEVFTDDDRKNILTYKYKGCDKGIVTKIIYDRICVLTLAITPTWVAPNVITLLDFISILFSHTLLAIYSWNFDNDMPAWICITASTCHTLYFIFDILDGMQARKTKAGSPLGMMFDHGCDALVSPLAVCNMLAIVRCQSPLLVFAFTISSLGGFYVATYETYHISGLFLREINAISEGAISIIFYAITAFVGSSAWNVEIFRVGSFVVTPFAILVLLAIIFQSLFNTCASLVNVLKKSERQKVGMCTLIRENISFIATITCALLSFYYTDLWATSPREMIYFIGILITALNVNILTGEVTKATLNTIITIAFIPCLVMDVISVLSYKRYSIHAV